jgi:ABC-type multidrug transport system fused ATPase/permease subunit
MKHYYYLSLLKTYFKHHIINLILGAFLVFLLSLLILPTPLITRLILDNTLPNKNLQELLILILIVFGLLIFTRIVSYFQGLLFYKINSKVVLDIRLDLLKKIGKLPLRISKKYSTGYLISRINDDTSRLQSLFADTMVSIVRDILTFLVGLTAIFIIHWKLALLSISILPLYIISTIYFSKKIRKLSKTYYEDSAQTTKQLEESLNMLELSKVFLHYKYNLLRYYRKAKRTYRSDIKLGRTSLLNGAITGFIGGIAPITIIGYGGYEIIQGRLTIGSLIAFNSFVGYLFGPASRLINVNIQIQKSLIALKRVRELFDLPEEEIDPKFQIKYNLNELAFKDVSFSYEKRNIFINKVSKDVNKLEVCNKNDLSLARKIVLNKINFRIENGQKIGIVGGSGSGKTTLLRLLSGLYEPNTGNIIINDKILANSEIIALRKYIAIVEQEPFLFDDTIFNNIRFGNPQAGDEDVILAAQQAYAIEFIEELPEKYQTKVGNKGGNLSVGQKQRIAIARALIRKPKILILDEATSNVDAISESYINKTIFNLPKNMIVIIVAHKLQKIQKCDKIFVIENGRIIESGSHKDLIENNGLYKKMFYV